jgi:hypothetical protein
MIIMRYVRVYVFHYLQKINIYLFFLYMLSLSLYIYIYAACKFVIYRSGEVRGFDSEFIFYPLGLVYITLFGRFSHARLTLCN